METTTASLAERLERQIHQRTWGRVRRLDVDVSKDRVTVHGTAPSYHVKQLAIQAVLETFDDSNERPRLEMDIEVCAVATRSPTGRFALGRG